MRLLLNHFQLLMLLASFRFDWPPPVKRLLSSFESVADAPQDLFSFDCLLQEFSPLPRFFSKLLSYFLFPIVATLVMVLFWKIYLRRKPQLFCSRFVPSLLIFCFILHPSIS